MALVPGEEQTIGNGTREAVGAYDTGKRDVPHDDKDAADHIDCPILLVLNRIFEGKSFASKNKAIPKVLLGILKNTQRSETEFTFPIHQNLYWSLVHLQYSTLIKRRHPPTTPSYKKTHQQQQKRNIGPYLPLVSTLIIIMLFISRVHFS